MKNQSESVLIGSIQKFSIEDGPGIRTTIFLKGCPLNCRWCHNPELIEPNQELIQSLNNCIGCGACKDVCMENAIYEEEGKLKIDREKCKVCLKCTKECYAKSLRPVAQRMTVAEVLEIAQQDKGFYDNTGGGITISGGEILLHAGFVKKLIEEAEKQDIKVCLDTSGFGNLNELLQLAEKENVTDILFDMKAFDDDIHKKYTGVSNKQILNNLEVLAANVQINKKLTIRMPLIRNINDSMEMIKRTGEFYKKNKISSVTLLPYHDLGISKQQNIGKKQERFQIPTEERINQIKEYFSNEIKLNVEILGRI